MELVEAAKVVEQGHEGLDDGRQLKDAVDEDVEDRKEPDADVAKVDGQVLRLGHLRQVLKEVLLRILLHVRTQINCLISNEQPENLSYRYGTLLQNA